MNALPGENLAAALVDVGLWRAGPRQSTARGQRSWPVPIWAWPIQNWPPGSASSPGSAGQGIRKSYRVREQAASWRRPCSEFPSIKKPF